MVPLQLIRVLTRLKTFHSRSTHSMYVHHTLYLQVWLCVLDVNHTMQSICSIHTHGLETKIHSKTPLQVYTCTCTVQHTLTNTFTICTCMPTCTQVAYAGSLLGLTLWNDQDKPSETSSHSCSAHTDRLVAFFSMIHVAVWITVGILDR